MHRVTAWALCVALVALAVVTLVVAMRPALLRTRGVRWFLVAALALCGLRALIGVVMDVVLLVGGRVPDAVSLPADLWFVVTAVLAGLLVRSRTVSGHG